MRRESRRCSECVTRYEIEGFSALLRIGTVCKNLFVWAGFVKTKNHTVGDQASLGKGYEKTTLAVAMICVGFCNFVSFGKAAGQ